MKKVTREEFLNHLKSGDIGINHSRNLFAIFQNWYRKRMKEGSVRASHGFYLKAPPKISEANGIIVKEGEIHKYIGNRTRVWVFRHKHITPDQIRVMNAYADSGEKTGGHYSLGGIWQFALSFFTKKKNWKDRSGVFCTEFTSRIILAGRVPYITNRDPWEITPSLQLNWFLTNAPVLDWIAAAIYDGEGNYYTNE